MRITLAEDYAVMFMGILSENYQKRLIPLSEISKNNHISLPFLKQIARSLKKQGLIISKEGVTGGYKLSKNPKDINLLEVFSCFEKRGLTPCCKNANGKHSSSCPIARFCTMKSTWQKINQEFQDKLESITLDHL